MIREIRLENYKAFGSEQRIPIKPITLVYGANSSGKSSILNAILLQKQTNEESYNPRTPLLFKGSFTDQQNYSRCINNRDVSKKLKISFGYDNEKINVYFGDHIRFGYRDSDKSTEITLDGIKKMFDNAENTFYCNRMYVNKDEKVQLACIEYKINDSIICCLSEIHDRYNLLWETIHPAEGLSADIVDKIPDEYLVDYHRCESYFQYSLDEDKDSPKSSTEMNFYEIDLTTISDQLVTMLYNDLELRISNNLNDKEVLLIENYNLDKFRLDIYSYLKTCVFLVKNGSPIHYVHKEKLPDNHIMRKRPLDCHDLFNFLPNYIVSTTSDYLQAIDNITYIGPLRKRPERFTDIVKDAYTAVGKDGEYASSIIYDNPYLVNDINLALSSLKVNYKINIHKITGDDQIALGDIHSLQIMENDTNTPLTLCDVGFGISQILPVLVQSIMPGATTVLIEQPEIHLHPKMQSELGDFFIKQAKSSQKQFVIETHSEHLLLRIMRRIRETTTGKLKPNEQSLALTSEDVSVLYVEPVGGESIVHELRLDDQGDFIDKWPQGFFDERMNEIF